jgi:hypothetical protein
MPISRQRLNDVEELNDDLTLLGQGGLIPAPRTPRGVSSAMPGEPVVDNDAGAHTPMSPVGRQGHHAVATHCAVHDPQRTSLLRAVGRLPGSEQRVDGWAVGGHLSGAVSHAPLSRRPVWRIRRSSLRTLGLEPPGWLSNRRAPIHSFNRLVKNVVFRQPCVRCRDAPAWVKHLSA